MNAPSSVRNLLALAFTLNFLSGPGQTAFMAMFTSPIQKDLGLSAGDLGSLYSLATLLGALALSGSGWCVDKVGLRRFGMFVFFGFVFGAGILATAQGPIAILIGCFFTRYTANASFPVLSRSIVASKVRGGRGTAFSLAGLGLPFGEAFMPGLAALLVTLIGWQETWAAFGGVIFVLFGPLLWFWLGRVEKIGELNLSIPTWLRLRALDSPQISLIPHRSVSYVLRSRKFWILLIPVLYPPFVLSGLFFYHATIAATKGWEIAWIGSAFVLYGVIHGICGLIAGPLIDTYTARRLLPWHLVPMLVGFSVLANWSEPWVPMVYLAFAAATVGFGGVVKQALWPEVYGTKEIHRILGVISSLITFSTALGPPIFGYSLDHGVELSEILWGVVALGVFAQVVLLAFGTKTGRL